MFTVKGQYLVTMTMDIVYCLQTLSFEYKAFHKKVQIWIYKEMKPDIIFL